MRQILPVFAVCAVVAAGAALPAAAEASCSGNACSVVTVAADGCAFANKGDKAVRFLLVAGGTARVITVLAPGETFREADKAFCVAENAGDKRYEASFATLGKAPADNRDFTLKGTKPAVAAAKPAVVAAAPVEVAVASTAIPLPRAKPAAPAAIPMPRAKPEIVEVAAPVPVAVAAPVAAVAPAAAVQPAEAPAAGAQVACAGTCPPILFKVIDDCLWVLNLNPRAVAFEAEVAGKHTALTLEAADGAKADERAAAQAGGKASKSDGALHMRLADPFQSAGSGIPIFRARLGSPGSCVKSRAEISRFTAAYVK